MKYKIGDRVYFAGQKFTVYEAHAWGIRIANESNRWNVTNRSVKPIHTCK